MGYYDIGCETDYDSLDYHSECGYHESLAEEGLTKCDINGCGRTYDMDEDVCPHCKRVCANCEHDYEPGTEICPNCKAEIEQDEPGGCYGCQSEVPTTSFMDKDLCWACYEALKNGTVIRDTCSFADPGGNSALRAAGPGNPRVHPCPNCQEPNRLTPLDISKGYQCDECADRVERGY